MGKRATTLPRDWREARRQRAYELAQKGWKQKDIAEALGVSKGAVSQWLKQARAGGEEALRRRLHPGPKRRLTEVQLEQLRALLSQGAEACGFRGDVWTQPRIAVLIEREFGVKYHARHMGRLMAVMGWSRQKPMRRPTQRNEETVQRWRVEDWPQGKKSGGGGPDDRTGG